ncbi:MAG: hypothetical protein K2J75_01870 [Clostridia bacterium]|nr:hypothetical protein [Clostridia bacterium]
MKVLTKELLKDVELFEIYCALDPKEKRNLPVVFLSGSPKGVVEDDIKTVKTQFDMTAKENEMSFMLLPATSIFMNDAFCETGKSGENELEKKFLSQYVNRLRIISHLPQEILKQVKDKRLLALGYAEQNVKKSILDYINERTTFAFGVVKNSLEDSLYTTVGLTIDKQFGQRPHIHSLEVLFDEAIITSVSKNKNDLYIELNQKDTIVLTDVETLMEEINPDKTFIKFFELHRTMRNYELHFLLASKDLNFIKHFHYVTYKFKDMRFI